MTAPLIETQIKIPTSGWLSTDDTVKRTVHLFCPWKTIAVGHGQQQDFSYGRDYLLAESANGQIWGFHGDSVLVRKMHPDAKEILWPPGKSLKLHIQHLLKKGYRIVGEMDSEGSWKSEHFSYVSQPINRSNRSGSAGASLQEQYPLSPATKKALEGITGPDWF